MNLFKGLIKCKSCGKNFNYKFQRNTEVYICQSRKNYGSGICDSKTVILQEILIMVQKHCKLFNIEFNELNCRELISEILIDINGNFTIKYNDNTTGEYNTEKIIF